MWSVKPCFVLSKQYWILVLHMLRRKFPPVLNSHNNIVDFNHSWRAFWYKRENIVFGFQENEYYLKAFYKSIRGKKVLILLNKKLYSYNWIWQYFQALAYWQSALNIIWIFHFQNNCRMLKNSTVKQQCISVQKVTCSLKKLLKSSDQNWNVCILIIFKIAFLN